MDGVNSTRMDLLAAWRLMNIRQQQSERAKNKNAKTKSYKETLEEEEKLLGIYSQSAGVASTGNKKIDNLNIKLSDLISQLKALECNDGGQSSTSSQQVTVSYERVETEVTVSYLSYERVDGLVLRNKHLAETDRYAFEFQDGATFRIIDKWSGKSTTIWGDPHVDTSDEEGNCNGEFSDLKSSDTHTTLKLEDDTQITFTARDNGVIEAVDIYKGSQHLVGYGLAYSDVALASSLFADHVDVSYDYSSRSPLGDMVYAGGDGNDWYNTAGQLIWGKTTGPRITSRPSSLLQISIRQSVESAFFSATINQKA
ncbi:MAG: DUF1521 domain-containing protein [Anaerolineales bacterium]|nr:DUF1521 domain-containing protein [Anaerolineales bacterium]